MARKVADKTLQIQSKGCGRLSPDIAALAEPFAFKVKGKKKYSFGWEADLKKKKLTLDAAPTTGDRLRFWRSGGQKSSGIIPLISVLTGFGLDPDALFGHTYPAKINGTKIEIQF